MDHRAGEPSSMASANDDATDQLTNDVSDTVPFVDDEESMGNGVVGGGAEAILLMEEGGNQEEMCEQRDEDCEIEELIKDLQQVENGLLGMYDTLRSPQFDTWLRETSCVCKLVDAYNAVDGAFEQISVKFIRNILPEEPYCTVHLNK